MSVIVHAGRLRFEMVRRGWAATDLARELRLSPATISAALAGRPSAAKSLDLIANTFTRVPARQAIDGLLMSDSEGLRRGEPGFTPTGVELPPRPGVAYIY